MFIQTEDTPNPDVLKFLPGREVLPEGYDGDPTIETKAQAKISPLAEAIFAIPGVSSLFLGGDFIAVARTKKKEWAVLRPLILEAIMDHYVSGEPVLRLAKKKEPAKKTKESKVVQKIKNVLDEQIRPQVARDGGDIVFDRYEDGIVYLGMRGACAGCPSATITLKSGVERILKQQIPEVQEVRPVRRTS